MQLYVNLNIEIPGDCIEHIRDKSFYDHNYYHLKPCGDWLYGKCDILSQKYHESDNCYTNALGYVENDKFIGMIYWVTSEDILDL